MQEVVKKTSESKKTGGVFVFLEQTAGILETVSLEVLGKGREIADQLGVSLTGILLGENLKESFKESTLGGADLVLVGESPLLGDFTTEAYSKVITGIVKEYDPDIFLVGATHNGTSLAANLAIQLHAGLMAHVVDLDIEMETGMLLGSVPGFGGNIVAVCKCKKGRPQMATVRPGIFKPLPISESRSGTVRPIKLDALKAEDLKCRVIEKSIGESVEISRAEKVVVAGLGLKGELTLAKTLAEKINGILAVSRPVADNGAAPKDLVVGSTGSSLNAKIALILGVSGAAHFSSGIRDVETVIAINSDPDAPIFGQADYCVNGDLFKIVPELVSELETNGGAI
ncbi:MAG TPA: electron transfer flavoprotein subunit alpha/FixB family protein [Nitrososphaerales archaeon]|nr:electron transfer flavoprotein subunit alpha/FixB family protein [Nitrososphaerales archaeon]